MTGSYVIEASGASGGNGTDPFVCPDHWKLGGLGAKITGTFQLNQGTQLKILVSHEGGTCINKALSLSVGGGGEVEGVQAIISQTVTQGRQQRTGLIVVEHRGVGVGCAMPAKEKKTPAYWQEGVLG